MMNPIHQAYLDNNATTVLLPEVRGSMVEALHLLGNPSSKHEPGRVARQAVEESRRTAAEFVMASHSAEILFCSSATEAITQAFWSGCQGVQQIVIGSTDHSAVLDAAERQSSRDLPCVRIPVTKEGKLVLPELERHLQTARSFVSVTLINNETGVVEEVASVAELCRKYSSLLHVDAAQAAGRVKIDIRELDCDYLTLSPHKFHGPKGVGILYLRNGAPRASVIRGHQEFGLRGGTENVPAIVGAAAAFRYLHDWRDQLTKIAQLRDRLEQGVLAGVSGSQVNGAGALRAVNTTNVYLPHRDAADLVAALSRKNVYVSAGAACSTGGAPSHVIQAMGYSKARANSSLRLSLSRFTTPDEIELAIQSISDVYRTNLISVAEFETTGRSSRETDL